MAIIAVAFLAHALLINVIGFPLSGMILFWGCAYALGSRNAVLDPLLAAVLSVLTRMLYIEDVLGDRPAKGVDAG